MNEITVIVAITYSDEGEEATEFYFSHIQRDQLKLSEIKQTCEEVFCNLNTVQPTKVEPILVLQGHVVPERDYIGGTLLL